MSPHPAPPLSGWRIEPACPADWAALLAACGGGLFHSPAGLAACGIHGEPWYARLVAGGTVRGIATGLWRRCRLSTRPRHVYLPSPPLLGSLDAGGAAVETLVRELARRGAAQVVMDSFDQRAEPAGVPGGATPLEDRLEYRVSLDEPPDGLASRLSAHHRRYLDRAATGAWSLRTPTGAVARTLLAAVQRHAAARAEARGDPFGVDTTDLACEPFDPARPWGVSLFSAWRGDEPLAAALVGWANRRGYYLQGGATPAGYAVRASLWLHWRVLEILAGAGFVEYGLGGTPAAAAAPGSPAFGLHRFKAGFGSRVVSCRGAQWTPRPAHLRAHRAVAWAHGRLRGSGATP